MELIQSIEDARNKVKEWKKQGLTVGFVPTMGYLHQGHGSLMEQARKENDKVVVSIFVNPTQFGVGEDLDSYPRDLEGDSKLCLGKGVDVIFAPTAQEMYPLPSATSVTMCGLTEELCGKSRPTHFSGVCLVVSKLFHIVPADSAYFGEKDAQQLAIIRKLVQDLNMDIRIVGCPIVRESDGLAMSSRNSYLTQTERKSALILSQTLDKAKVWLQEGERDASVLVEQVKKSIGSQSDGILDYAELVDAETLHPVSRVEKKVLLALAVKFGKTRLIDNMTYGVED